MSSTNNDDEYWAKKSVLFFMYFDEAHTMTIATSRNQRSPYHILGWVLGNMLTVRQFSIFLSTNSWLGGFAPSPSKHPSVRDWENTRLHAPFTELPFDTFAKDSYSALLKDHPGGVKLEHICQLSHIVKFGRPL